VGVKVSGLTMPVGERPTMWCGGIRCPTGRRRHPTTATTLGIYYPSYGSPYNGWTGPAGISGPRAAGMDGAVANHLPFGDGDGSSAQAGSYYIGFYNGSGSIMTNFYFHSRAIGTGMSCDLAP